MKRLGSIILALLLGTLLTAQNGNFKPKVWRLTQLSGNVRLSGTYTEGTNLLAGSNDETKNSTLSAGVSLFTRSFIYHPNLLSLDITGSYEPRIQQYQALVRPDYSTNSSSS